jgi:hypothetical protein
VAVYAWRNPVIRNVETLLPDHDQLKSEEDEKKVEVQVQATG